jgi:hypothetical protein
MRRTIMATKKNLKANATANVTKRATKADSTRGAKKGKAPAESMAAAEKLSAIDAAVRVLGENGRAMTCKEMISAMAARGFWTSPAGKTPSATLYSGILKEINLKGTDARFKKTERGKFALAKASL